MASNELGRLSIWPHDISKVWVCYCSLAGTAGMAFCFFRMLVCFQLEVSLTGRSLIQRSPTEFMSFIENWCNNNPLHP
jgi:hypothetical protein